MSLPVAAQITILLTAGGSVWLRAANKDVQHVPAERQELIVSKNRTVAAERLRYTSKDFTIDNPATYFSTDALEFETRTRLNKISNCLNANRRCRILIKVIRVLSAILIFLGIASIVCAAGIAYLAATGTSDTAVSALFLKTLYVLGALLIGITGLEAALLLHGREYDDSRARTSLS